MKISPVKNNVAPKILVDKSIQEPYLGYLNQASGVIENYLKYEKDVGQIFIKNGDFWRTTAYCRNYRTVGRLCC